MSLTTAQLQTLKAAILADNNLTAWVTAGSTYLIAQYLQTTASTFVVWKTTTNVSDIYDAIQWANLTPTDAVPTDTQLNVEIWMARNLECQSKQLNLQIMLQGQMTVNSLKSNVRGGLQDALTNIPSGAGGVIQAANWVAVKTAMQRFATKFEALYATGTGTATTPGALTLEGGPQEYDVIQALAS